LLEDTNNYLTWSFWLHKMQFNKKKFANLDNIQNIDRYDGSHYVIDSALSAQGIAMSRHSMVADAIQQNQLVKIFDMEVELNAQFYLCAPEHYFLYPKIQAFTQWIQEEVEEFITYK